MSVMCGVLWVLAIKSLFNILFEKLSVVAKLASSKYVTVAAVILPLLIVPLALHKTAKEVRKAARNISFDTAGIDQFSSKNNEGYELMRFASGYPDLKGKSIYQYGFENAIYFYDSLIMGDWFGPARYSQMMSMPPDIVEQNLRKLGAAAMVINNVRAPFNEYDKEAFKNHFQLIKENRFGAIYLL